MDTYNGFSKGMNQDTSKLKYQQENYLEGLNLRVLTDEGLSSLAIENTKGTVAMVSVPKTGWGGTFNPVDYYGVGTPDVTLTLYDALGGPPLVIALGDVSQLTNQEIWSLIQGALTLPFSNQYRITYSEEYLFIQLLDYSTTQVADITWDTGSGTQTDALPLVVSESYLANFQPFILGWGLIREDVVLLVCDRNSTNVNPTGELGQVWSFSINQITGGATITAQDNLIYSNVLNFSREYAIYKEVKTRYENPEVATVVWTDNFNELRTINILDPQVMATSPGLLSYKPRHLPSLPVVTNVIPGGLLVSGTYQYFYRLRSTQGAYSTWSPMSQPVNIGVIESTQDTSSNIGGEAGSSANKSVEITISSLDDIYDLVELGYTIYQTPDVPESFTFAQVPIPNSREVVITHNGTEVIVPIEDDGNGVEALNNANRPPDVFKTIEVLRNRLYAANAKTFSRQVNFDARAYRFNSARRANLFGGTQSFGDVPQIRIIANVSGDITDILLNGVSIGTDLTDISDLLDLINPYNNENPSHPLNGGDWLTNSQYKYQADGITYGGTGANISYSFVEIPYNADIRNEALTRNATPLGVPSQNQLGVVQIGNGFNTPEIENYPENYQNPQLQQFVGYARGETYRFGIVFYDKAGYPFFTEWIGDIKFPQVGDGFNLERSGSDNTVITPYSLGIRFTLDTTTPQFQALKNQISGWQFVRLPRKVQDRTRLGTGLGFQLVANVPTAEYLNTTQSLNVGGPVNNLITFDSPNSAFRAGFAYQPGDYLKVIGRTRAVAPTAINPANLNGGIVVKYTKSSYFLFSDPEYTTYGINFCWLPDRVTAEQRLSDALLAPFSFFNMANISGTDYNSWGERTALIQTSSNIDFSNLTTSPGTDKLIFSYERYLANQYGGNTRFARYENEYISTGAVVQYTNQSGNLSVLTFGGDCWTWFFDFQKLERNFEDLTGTPAVAPPPLFGLRNYLFFPAETHGFNPEMRLGPRVATKALLESSNLLQDLVRNQAYDQQNTLQSYLSKPFQILPESLEPNTIYVTDPKIDGETLNSWRNFRVLDSLTVNGNYGPINRLIEFKEKLIFYQTDAVGIAANEERVTLTAETGEPTTIGTGEILQRYDYISTQTGAYHQFAVEKSGQAVYHYDIYLNKLFRLDQSTFALSDVLGLSSFFRNTFQGTILITDKLTRPARRGVHAIFNPEFNTILFTFIDDNKQVTISYNELLQAFDSFHSFAPSFYLNTRRRLHAVDWDNTNHNSIHTLFKGPYNRYFGQYFPTYLKTLSNAQNPYDKTWDNQEFRTEVTLNGQDLQETISQLRYTNDYQTTNLITLTPTQNIKRMLRTWRVQIPFDQTVPTLPIKPRMMDKHLITEIWYNNIPNQERRFILHDIRTELSLRAKINLPNK